MLEGGVHHAKIVQTAMERQLPVCISHWAVIHHSQTRAPVQQKRTNVYVPEGVGQEQI